MPISTSVEGKLYMAFSPSATERLIKKIANKLVNTTLFKNAPILYLPKFTAQK